MSGTLTPLPRGAAWYDRARPRESRFARSEFRKVRDAEREYARRLRAVAKQVSVLVRGFFPGGAPAHANAAAQLVEALHRYAALLAPWAHATANRMLADVSRRDLRAWKALRSKMAYDLWAEVRTAPTGEVMRARLAEQVELITSLPREAAQRVHRLTTLNLVTGGRAGEVRGASPRPGLAAEVLKTGHVTVSRANLIARTETSRTATELMRARAEHVGSDGYVWRTARDRDVRRCHRKLEGTFHAWDDPPIAEESGERHHPGEFPNCRCWSEPVLPEVIT